LAYGSNLEVNVIKLLFYIRTILSRQAPERIVRMGQADILPTTQHCHHAGKRRSKFASQAKSNHVLGIFVFFCTFVFVFTVATTEIIRTVEKRMMDISLGVVYRFDSEMHGRTVKGPRCCYGVDCLSTSKNRFAVVTYLTTGDYFPFLQQLECTLRKSNPDVEFAIMLPNGHAEDGVEQKIQNLGIKIIRVDDISYPNKYEHRFAGNWLKLRAFELTEYDAVILLDSDTVVLQDISELFHLPTDFAASLDQAPWLNQEKALQTMIQGGMMFLRPCQAMAEDMYRILRERPKLRFTIGNAEQEFLSWYFRYSVWLLPDYYNAMNRPSLRGNTTRGGFTPKIVHFTSDKPINGHNSDTPGHQFLCSPSEIENRPSLVNKKRKFTLF
jgi:hypothetical protein